MKKVISVSIERLDNAGCNNGNYPHAEITLSNGESFTIQVCSCGHGCSNTDVCPEIGQIYQEENYQEG